MRVHRILQSPQGYLKGQWMTTPKTVKIDLLHPEIAPWHSLFEHEVGLSLTVISAIDEIIEIRKQTGVHPATINRCFRNS